MTATTFTTKTGTKKRQRMVAISLLVVLVLSVLPGIAYADQPPQIPAWHDGQIVHFTVVNENVEGRNRPADQVPIPLYAFGFPPAQPQADVLSAVPGNANYNPWWEVFIVVVLDGRDVTTNPFTSDEEILAAAAAGKVLLIDTNFVFLCQVLP